MILVFDEERFKIAGGGFFLTDARPTAIGNLDIKLRAIPLGKSVKPGMRVILKSDGAQLSLRTAILRCTILPDVKVRIVGPAYEIRPIEVIKRRNRQQQSTTERVNPRKIKDYITFSFDIANTSCLPIGIVRNLIEILAY